MNVLSYRTSELNGLTFDLLIDDQSVQEIFESDTVGIPYWLLEGGLATMTVMEKPYRIISVCDCGECGCGVIACRVTEESDTDTFDDFKFLECDLSFTFTAENYHKVMDEIGHEVLRFSGPQTEVATEQHNFDVMKAYLNAVEDLLRKPSVRDCIAQDSGIEKYGAQVAADWICDARNYEAVRNLILIDKHKYLLLEDGPVTPPILQHEHVSWTIKVMPCDDNTKLICTGYLDKVGSCVGTKSLKFERAVDVDC